MPRNEPPQTQQTEAAKKKPWRRASVRTVDMYVTLSCVSTGCPDGMQCDSGTGQCVPGDGGP